MNSVQDPHRILWNTFKKGDWEAYTSLYHLYYGLLNNYGYKFTRDADLIADTVHDLFERLWTNRNNLGEPLSVKNYLYKSLRNILFRKIKSHSRFSTIQDDESIPFEVSHDNHLIVTEDEMQLQVTIKQVLHQLPPRQQEIIFLRFYDGLSYEEIADIMAIHINSAYKLLYKALENVQKSIGLVTLVTIEIMLQSPLHHSTSQKVMASYP